MDLDTEVKPVLVIDDDPEWLSFACTTLVARYPVLCCLDAENGIALAAAVELAAVVLDVMMPDGRDGFSTFCELRKGRRTRTVPVLMFSEVNKATGLEFSTSTMKQYLGSAPAAFLEKPIDPEELLNAVTRAIGKRM